MSPDANQHAKSAKQLPQPILEIAPVQEPLTVQLGSHLSDLSFVRTLAPAVGAATKTTERATAIANFMFTRLLVMFWRWRSRFGGGERLSFVCGIFHFMGINSNWRFVICFSSSLRLRLNFNPTSKTAAFVRSYCSHPVLHQNRDIM